VVNANNDAMMEHVPSTINHNQYGSQVAQTINADGTVGPMANQFIYASDATAYRTVNSLEDLESVRNDEELRQTGSIIVVPLPGAVQRHQSV
jgi:hypothetical protein